MSLIKDKEDKYLYGEYENKFFIKLVGNSTMRNSKTLDDLFNKLLKEEKRQVIIDFGDCNYMDSTVLGVIAKNSVKIKKIWGESVYAVNVQGSVKLGLTSTGIDKVLMIIENQAEAPVEMQQAESTVFTDKESKTLHILEAHKMLMTLNDENKKVFKNVVDLMEKEISK